MLHEGNHCIIIRINKDFKMNPLIAICSYPKVFSIFWEGGGDVFKKLNIQTKLACIS